MARKTPEESQKTRDAILDAAEVVFLKKGVTHASMADIAEQAGVSRGAVYGHYKNKMELGLAMCQRAFEAEDYWKEGKAVNVSPLERLRRQHLFHMKQYCESDTQRRVLEILYTRCERTPENDEMLRLKEQFEKECEDDHMLLLNEAVSSGELPRDLDVGLAFAFLNTMVCGQCSLLMCKEMTPEEFMLALEPFLDASLDAMRHSLALRKR